MKLILQKGIKIAALVATVFTFACSTMNTVERAEPMSPKSMIDDKRVVTDAGLDRRVRVVGVNESTQTGKLLKIQVEVVNTTRSTQSFNYKFEWFDENGLLITNPTSPLVPKMIEGKESVFLTSTAPNDRAKDFRLKLIEN